MRTQNPNLPSLCATRGHLHPVLCLELCPPRDGDWRVIETLVKACERFTPDFLTMTDTGKSRGRDSVKAAIQLQRGFGLPVVAHLACTDRSKSDFLRAAGDLAEAGIRHLLVLRGDPARGTTFHPHPQGFAHANEALEGLREHGLPFITGTACHLLGHPDDTAPNQELTNMARKVAAGSQFFVNQVSFDHGFNSYRERIFAASKAGASVPILPCHLAISTTARLASVAARCGAVISNEVLEKLKQRGDRYLPRELAGFARSTWVQGAPGIYVSTLNDPKAYEFLRELFDSHVARTSNP